MCGVAYIDGLMVGVMAYWTANVDVWFKDCKLDTRYFVGLGWYIVIAVYDHLLGSASLIPRLIYNSHVGFMNYAFLHFLPMKQITPA